MPSRSFGLVICLFSALTPSVAQSVPQGNQTASSFESLSTDEEPFVPEYCDSIATSIPHGEALRGTCSYAETFRQRLPNFVCEQTSVMSYPRLAGQGHPNVLVPVPSEIVSSVVRYDEGRESHSDIKVNGKPVDKAAYNIVSTKGEFGSNLRSIFDPANKAVIEFTGEGKLQHRPTWVFNYEIAQQDVHWPLFGLRNQKEGPPYSGKLWIDQQTNAPLRLEAQTSKMPNNSSVRASEMRIDYGEVPLSDGTRFVLPKRFAFSSFFSGGGEQRYVVEFRNCSKSSR